MKNYSYFSTMNTIQNMAQQTFVNQKLDFVEELVLYTDSHISLPWQPRHGQDHFLEKSAAKDLQTYGRGRTYRCGGH